jgi:DNA-directed RNA polymerase specialized sigma24 family protein
VTTDEVKKYLRQAEKLDKRLKRERRNLEKLMSAAEYRSPAFEGVGGGGSGDKICAAVSRIMEEEQRVQELTDLYTAKYVEIEQTIKSIGDDALEEVLELRYLHNKSWEDIANIMHYALRSVYEFHGQALQKIAVNCIELQ